jgi:dsRNA-specific ribonuclease
LDLPFTEAEEVPESRIPDYEIVNHKMPSEQNYVGRLLESAMKYKNWSNPEFTFQMTGPSNTPTINCKGEIDVDNNTIFVYATGSTKQDAKQLAAKKMLKIIKDTVVIEEQEPVRPSLETDIASNNVGLVQEFCMKNKLPVPEYLFSQKGLKHITLFICDLKFTFKDNKYHWSASGITKKEAKQNVAEKAYQELKELKTKK